MRFDKCKKYKQCKLENGGGSLNGTTKNFKPPPHSKEIIKA